MCGGLVRKTFFKQSMPFIFFLFHTSGQIYNVSQQRYVQSNMIYQKTKILSEYRG